MTRQETEQRNETKRKKKRKRRVRRDRIVGFLEALSKREGKKLEGRKKK